MTPSKFTGMLEQAGEQLAAFVPPHPSFGRPRQAYPYRNGDNRVYLACLLTGGELGKEYRPFVVQEVDSKALRGQWGFAPPQPRRLYQDSLIGEHAANPVVVVEGEKCVVRLKTVLPGYDITTSMNGAKSAAATDWSPTAGREVWILPDKDDAGQRYAQDASREAMRCGAGLVRTVDTKHLEEIYCACKGVDAGAAPAGFDIADVVDAGGTTSQIVEAIQKGLIGDGRLKEKMPGKNARFCLRPNGLYAQVKRGDEPAHVRIASPMKIIARGRDHSSRRWVVIVEVQDLDGHWHRHTIPCEHLSGLDAEYSRELLGLGLRLEGGREASRLLRQYLVHFEVEERARVVTRPGWHGGVYIRGDKVIGVSTGEQIVMAEPGPLCLEFKQQGTLDEWKDHVACLAVNNTRLAFAISLTLGSFMCRMLGHWGAGVNLVGSSSIGKTTLLYAAASTVSYPGPDGLVQTWRATGTALEAVCEGSNDGPLFLDELSEVNSDVAGETAYMIANGQGKKRGRAAGGLRDVSAWQVIFLSTGEISLEQKLAETGKVIKAGQSVRIIDLPAAAGEFGAFEDLHGCASPQIFVEKVMSNCRKYYGTPVDAWLNYLALKRDEVVELAKGACREFVTTVCPQGCDGQISRVAKTFAVASVAAELAIGQGILPWPKGEGVRCAMDCFAAWVEHRGSYLPGEVAGGLRRLASFIQRYGSARFEDCGGAGATKTVVERAGWRRHTTEGDVYMFTPASLKDVVKMQEKPFAALRRHLSERGWLVGREKGCMHSQPERIPGVGKSVRVYTISADILGLADTDTDRQ